MANRVIRQVPGTLFKKDGIAALAASFSPQRLSFGDGDAERRRLEEQGVPAEAVVTLKL